MFDGSKSNQTSKQRAFSLSLTGTRHFTLPEAGARTCISGLPSTSNTSQFVALLHASLRFLKRCLLGRQRAKVDACASPQLAANATSCFGARTSCARASQLTKGARTVVGTAVTCALCKAARASCLSTQVSAESAREAKSCQEAASAPPKERAPRASRTSGLRGAPLKALPAAGLSACVCVAPLGLAVVAAARRLPVAEAQCTRAAPEGGARARAPPASVRAAGPLRPLFCAPLARVRR